MHLKDALTTEINLVSLKYSINQVLASTVKAAL